MLTRRDIDELLDRHGLAPRRSRGQNFVADPNTVRRIVRLAGVRPGDQVVEVGPGLGSLTLALAEAGARVRAVEVDPGLAAALRAVLAERAITSVEVVEADAMHADWAALLGEGSWHLVANLPYNIATPLVADLLDGVPAIGRMFVMVQREVAERLAARPGDEAYGAVSVKVAYWADATVVGLVPPTVFVPRPNVESALVRIVRREHPAVDSVEPEALFSLVRAGFAKRRKMLRRSLAGLADAADFEAAGVRPEARAEELAVEQWGALARAVQRRTAR